MLQDKKKEKSTFHDYICHKLAVTTAKRPHFWAQNGEIIRHAIELPRGWGQMSGGLPFPFQMHEFTSLLTNAQLSRRL